LPIPLVDPAVPDVFVSVVMYWPPTAGDPVPRYKVGYVELPVSTATRVLNVAITPDRDQAKPGDLVHYAIKVTDRSGKGVRSELSVAVVDKAVLSLQEERGPDGLHAFWFERGLSVATGSSMAVSVDRWNDVIAELPKQGKGGSGLAQQQTRQDFRNTAYWGAQLLTKDVTVQPSQSVVVTWPAKVESEGKAKLTFTATGPGDLADSVVQELPVYMDVTPETTATGGVVTKDGALEALYLPPFADTKHGSLSVSVQSALTGSMAEELPMLVPYIYEGSERVASRLIATIAVRRAEK